MAPAPVQSCLHWSRIARIRHPFSQPLAPRECVCAEHEDADLDANGARHMTKRVVLRLCRERGIPTSPGACSALVLHAARFKSIAGLEDFTAVRVLHLENNCLTDLTGLVSAHVLGWGEHVGTRAAHPSQRGPHRMCLLRPPLPQGHMTALRALHLQQNSLRSLEGLAACTSLSHLNVSHNPLGGLPPGALPASLLTLQAASIGERNARHLAPGNVEPRTVLSRAATEGEVACVERRAEPSGRRAGAGQGLPGAPGARPCLPASQPASSVSAPLATRGAGGALDSKHIMVRLRPQVLDLQHNGGLRDAAALLPALCELRDLRVLYTQGCQLSNSPNFRRVLVSGLSSLSYLDSMPVEEVERAGAVAWLHGGREAEQVRARSQRAGLATPEGRCPRALLARQS